MKKILLFTLAALLLFSGCAAPAAQPTQPPPETAVPSSPPQTAAPAAETAPGPTAEPEGVRKTGSMELEYASQFSVDYYSDGSALLSIGEDRFLILPEGLEEPGFETDAVIIRRYKETRRRHPMAPSSRLPEGIATVPGNPVDWR